MSTLRDLLARLGPLARLSLVGALIATLTAAVVATWIESRMDDLLLTQVAERAEDQVQLAILGNVRASDFELPYSAEKRADLAARLDPLLERARQSDSGIIRFNIFAPDGTILYSDTAALRGRTVSPIADAKLARALAGTPGADISTLDGIENSDLRPRYSRALEAYIPFALEGRVVGVYEFYEDLAPIEPIRPLVWGSVAVGAAVVFGTTLLVVSRMVPPPPQMPTSLRQELPRPQVQPVLIGTVSPVGSVGAVGSVGTANRELNAPAHWLLTRREVEVLRHMAEGLTYAQIAARLVVDEETVRSHAKGVLRKLGQSSRADAVATARKVGLL